MSGPSSTDAGDASPAPGSVPPKGPILEVTTSRASRVGRLDVRRALPRRGRRTVGAWCFADHLGPVAVTEEAGVDVGPHPHIGLQTVTWLLAGEVLHRDSLGSEQVVRPGQLNLMTAGRGVVHAEEATGRYRGPLHGVQLWVAQPSATRDGPPAFEHHAELPRLEMAGPGGGTAALATVLLGELDGARSPARRDSDHVGVDLELVGPPTAVALRAGHEHAVVVLDGVVTIDGTDLKPGHLAYLGTGRDELGVAPVDGPARILLLGGTPFAEQVAMWWNFVARSRDELGEARRQWSDGDPRFGPVASRLEPVTVAPPPWETSAAG